MTAIFETLAGRILLADHWRRALIAVAAGAVLALTLAPLDIMVAGFLAFPVLVWLLDGAVAEPQAGVIGARLPAFFTGWWFGLGYFLAGLWWIGAAVLVDAETFAWALPIAVLGLPALLAVFFGLACAVANLFWRDGLSRVLILAAAFGAAELARGAVLTGFPWNALGQTVASGPWLMQSAVIGVDALAPVAVLIYSAPALLSAGRPLTALGLPAVLLGAMLAWGLARPALQPVGDAPLLSVRIVQPSIDQNVKWDEAQKDAIFDTLMRLTRDGPATATGTAGDGAAGAMPPVVVWPETALPFLIEERPQALTLIAEALPAQGTLLTGAIRVEGEAASARFYNSVIAIDTEGTVAGAADKLHLVPFGEYLPLADWLVPLGLDPVAVTPGTFARGTRVSPLVLPGGAVAVPLVCYEVIFPQAVRDAAAEGAKAAAQGAGLFLVNVTNDAWYGATPGPYQHFRQAQLRAVETGLPLVRAANNGLSGVIDPFGRVSGGLALDAVAAADVTFGLDRFATPHGVHGIRIAAGLCAMLALAGLFAAWLQGRRRRTA